MEGKINGLALSANTREDTRDYGLIHDPFTGCPIIYQVSDNPPLPGKSLMLSHWTEGPKKITVVFYKV